MTTDSEVLHGDFCRPSSASGLAASVGACGGDDDDEGVAVAAVRRRRGKRRRVARVQGRRDHGRHRQGEERRRVVLRHRRHAWREDRVRPDQREGRHQGLPDQDDRGRHEERPRRGGEVARVADRPGRADPARARRLRPRHRRGARRPEGRRADAVRRRPPRRSSPRRSATSSSTAGPTTHAARRRAGEVRARQGLERHLHGHRRGARLLHRAGRRLQRDDRGQGGRSSATDKVDSLSGKSDFGSTISKINAQPAARRDQRADDLPADRHLREAAARGRHRHAGARQRDAADARAAEARRARTDPTRSSTPRRSTSRARARIRKAIRTSTSSRQDYEAKFGTFPEQANGPGSYQALMAINEALQQEDVIDAASAAAAIRAQDERRGARRHARALGGRPRDLEHHDRRTRRTASSSSGTVGDSDATPSRRRRGQAPLLAVLTATNIVKRFGGVTALAGVDLELAEGRGARPDRSERVRQDDARQLHLGRARRSTGARSRSQGRAMTRAAGAPGARRAGADVPEPAPVRGPDRARERDRRAERPRGPRAPGASPSASTSLLERLGLRT